MKPERFNFKKNLRSEIALIFLFALTFCTYFLNFVNPEFKEWLYITVGFLGIIPVARSAFESLRNKRVNVDLLATIALFFSFVNEEWLSMLFINLMLAMARILDIYTKHRVHTSLESLLKLKPATARVFRNNAYVEVPIREVLVGDIVLVNLGEQIPVDGVIIEGTATVNQASLTGESLPILREVGSAVLAATIVTSGTITVRTERIGTETTFERMLKLIETSHGEKSRIKTLAESFAGWYISIVLVVAVILFIATNDTSLVLAVVLVVCADDIAIAVPLAHIVAIGTMARRGVIVKSADFLEQMGKITTLVVDKTGTVTLGKLFVVDCHAFGKTDAKTLLTLASSLTARSNHPVSVAIHEYASKQGYQALHLKTLKEIEGRGIVGITKNDEKIVIGRLEFLDEYGAQLNKEDGKVVTAGVAKGNNMTLLSLNDQIIGVFAVADEIREGVADTIQDLKKHGINEFIMLTGDNEGVAKNIASKIGIEKYYAKLLPEHKIFVLRDYLGKKNRVIAMMGDGINDAAVLAESDVGIAMGGIGADAAIESADIVLMEDNIQKVLELRETSEKVRNIVYENFAIWGAVNVIGLYLVFTHVFTPAHAAAYNFLTYFIPIINSLRMFVTIKHE